MYTKRVCVTGAGGMIGGHLVKRLLDEGHRVTAVDVKPWLEWNQRFDDAKNLEPDLNCIVVWPKQIQCA